jgi:magnesium-transporting ATPase (P-type)
MQAVDVLAYLHSQENGSSNSEATERLQRYGPNRLPEAVSRSAWQRFLLQFHSVLIYVLLAVGLLVLFQLGFTYVPFMQQLFGTAAISAVDWLQILLVGSSVFWLVEFEKMKIRDSA